MASLSTSFLKQSPEGTRTLPCPAGCGLMLRLAGVRDCRCLFQLQCCRTGSPKSALMGELAPQKSAETANDGFLSPLPPAPPLAIRHFQAHHGPHLQLPTPVRHRVLRLDPGNTVRIHPHCSSPYALPLDPAGFPQPDSLSTLPYLSSTSVQHVSVQSK